MSILSIFVDESGDFGKLDKTSPYYLVTLVFHDQSNSIKEQLEKLDESMRYEETPHIYTYRTTHSQRVSLCEHEH